MADFSGIWGLWWLWGGRLRARGRRWGWRWIWRGGRRSKAHQGGIGILGVEAETEGIYQEANEEGSFWFTGNKEGQVSNNNLQFLPVHIFSSCSMIWILKLPHWHACFIHLGCNFFFIFFLMINTVNLIRLWPVMEISSCSLISAVQLC